jgi:hypothetical protein
MLDLLGRVLLWVFIVQPDFTVPPTTSATRPSNPRSTPRRR